MQLSKPCLDGIIIPRDILFVNCINFFLPLQIQENITCAQSKQKRAYSKKMAKGVQVFNFKEGDHVLRRNMVKANTKGNNCKKYFSMRWKPVVHTPDIKYNYLVITMLARRVNGSRYRTAESIPERCHQIC